MKTGINAFYLLVVLIFVPQSLPAESPERENLNRVIQTLQMLSIPFEQRSLLAGFGGFGYSLLVRAGGNAPGTFILALPLDAEFAVDTGLALAEKTQNHNNPVNIIIAFLGNERNRLPDELGGASHKGLRDILTLVDIPENWVLCYLDIAQRPEGLLISHGTEGYVTPLEILKPLAANLSSGGIPWSFHVRFNEIYRLGLVEGHQAMSIAWAEEVNSFVLAGKNTYQNAFYGETISPHELAEFILNYAVSIDFPMLNLDRHYFFFTAPWRNIVLLGEGFTVALLLILVGICLFLFLVYSVKYNAILLFNARLFFKSIWIFFLLLILLVVSITASGFLYSMLFMAFGPPVPGGLPAETYFIGAGLTILLAVLVFFLHSPLFSLIRIPKREHFYGFSSVIFAAAGLFTAAFLDFSFVPAFLWASFFVFFAASVSKPILVFLCVILIPLFAVGVVRNIIETESVIIAKLFISPEWRTIDGWLPAFMTALFSLPIILLVKRGVILTRTSLRLKHKPKSEYRLIVVSILIFVVLSQMTAHIFLLPGDHLPPERRFIVEGPDIIDSIENEILTLALESTHFQDSTVITLRLAALGSPVRFDVFLESENGFNLIPVYSAPVPFQRYYDGRLIRFSLGEDPPNPLSLELALPRNFFGRLKTAAIFDTWDPAVDPWERPGTDDYILSVSRVVALGQPPPVN